jgi:hypothetical protein
MEDYPFGAIKNLREDDVKFEHCLKNAPWLITPISVEIN